jgi:hypothetical protein
MILTQERIDLLKLSIEGCINTDPTLAAYILRDQDVVKAYKLDTLAHLCAFPDAGYTHKNDVLFIIELLERHLANGDEPEPDED